ncbi:MAG TPA: COX15/CtaA family protein [Burkholderiales bacterium]|nr:COX15/CtaA family protein [Burkholderiales bacterium]
MKAYRTLVLAAALLALVVVVVGAFVRLSDAGLGCPDWPGCYGKPAPTLAKDAIARAVAHQGGERGPVSLGKAWKEMGHRYLAGTLGLLILTIALLGWLRRRALGQSPWLASAIVIVVALQAALGMWTVTLLLRPAVVTAHLAGGMTTLALLLWLSLRQWRFRPAPEARKVRALAALALCVVATQIMLGGWVSANYAALACPDWPLCLGQVVPPMDFAHAFRLLRELGRTGDGTMLAFPALTAIHWTHRTFALVVALVVGWTAYRTVRLRALRPLGWLIAALLGIQFSLGVANVLAGLPLAVADAHNAGAALLLGSLVVLNFFAFHGLCPRLPKA